MAGQQKLGIPVPTGKYIDYLMGIVRAAKNAGKAVCIFLTHEGCFIRQDPVYQELPGILAPEAEDRAWEYFFRPSAYYMYGLVPEKVLRLVYEPFYFAIYG